MPSPDEADALALTFFSGAYAMENQFPVYKPHEYERGMFT